MSTFLDDLLSDFDPRPVIPFGKYRGQPLSKVAEVDASYLKWMLTTDNLWAADHAELIREAIFEAQDALLKNVAPVTVTPHQQERVDQLLTWVDAGRTVIRLAGGAGYGKSYSIQKFVHGLRERRYSVCAAATSYVATQNIAKDLEPLGVETRTIAKTVRLSKVFDNGVEDYVVTADSALAANNLLEQGNCLIVDEDSMVSDDIAQLLLTAAQRGGGLLVCVGDAHQLPPVKQPTPSMLCLTPDTTELQKPMRYSEESDLFQVERMARRHPFQLLDFFRRMPVSDQYTRVSSQDALIERYVDNYRNDATANHRMLMFRRADVVECNNRIRAALHGADAPVVTDGEQLMVLKTSDFPWKGPTPVQGETTRYYSGESFRVVQVERGNYEITIGGVVYHIPYYRVMFQDRPDRVRIIFAVTEATTDTTKLGGLEFQAAVNAAVTVGRETGDWIPFRRLMNDFVAVAYLYATSIHRCQGQTTDYCYITPAPLLSVRGIMGPALSYVASTRARKHLTVQINA